jgi:hypothetical protein
LEKPVSSIVRAFVFAAFVGAQSTAPAPVREVADVAALLPSELWFVAEGDGLGDVARHWLESPLQRRVVASGAWKRFAKTPQHAQLLTGIGFVQLVAGMPVPDLLGALLGERIVVGLTIDHGQPALVAATRSTDADVAQQIVTALRGVALQDKEHPPRTVTHRGVDLLVANEKLWVAAVGRDLLAASTESAIGGLVDRALDAANGTAQPASVAPLLATMRARTEGDLLLRFAADTRKIAATRPGGRLAPAQADNFVGAMVVGDLLELATTADVVCGSVAAHGDELSLHLGVPGDVTKLPAHFRSFCHREAQSPLLALAPKNTLLTWSLRRNWAQFWEDRAQLCDPTTEHQFAEMKQNLGLFFGGKSLPDEILPQVGDEILFVLSRQTFPNAKETPKTKAPAGAYVYRVKDGSAASAKRLGRLFAVGVHEFVAIANVDRSTHQQPSLLPFVEPFENVTVYGGRVPQDDEQPPDPSGYNLSPCATWVGDRVILASSEELLHELVHELTRAPADLEKAAAPGRTGRVPSGVLDYLRVDGPAAAQFARENREFLVTQGILEKGKTPDESAAEADLLAEALDQLASATLAERVDAAGIAVDLAIVLTPFVATAPRTGGS